MFDFQIVEQLYYKVKFYSFIFMDTLIILKNYLKIKLNINFKIIIIKVNRLKLKSCYKISINSLHGQ